MTELRPQQQSRHIHLQWHSPYRCRSPHRTHSLYSSSMQMRDISGRVPHAPFVMPNAGYLWTRSTRTIRHAKCGISVDAFHMHHSSCQMRDICGRVPYAPPLSLHPSSCQFIAGRIPRHSTLSDVVRHGLSAAGIPSMLEPWGPDRGNRKRPDGIALHPYSRGRCLIRDGTCVNTYAFLNLIRATLAAGPVANAEEVKRNANYAVLGRRIIFQTAAAETSAAMGNRRSNYFKDLGRRFPILLFISPIILQSINCLRSHPVTKAFL